MGLSTARPLKNFKKFKKKLYRLNIACVHSLLKNLLFYLRESCAAELSMGWVDTWIGLDWVGLGRDFSVLVGWVGWFHCSKSTKILKGLR